MLIVDSHLDIAHNALEWNRDLLRPIAGIREAEAGMTQKGRGLNAVNFAELRRGGIGLFFVTVHSRLASMGKRFPGVRTQDIAYARCGGELAYYRLMVARGVLRQVRNRAELDAHLAEWDNDPQTTPLGFVLSMEGADGIVAPDQVPEWWDEGLRIVSLCHYGVSAYSHGTQAPGGLTARGRPMLEALEAAGIILDVSHLAEQAFWGSPGGLQRSRGSHAQLLRGPCATTTASSTIDRSRRWRSAGASLAQPWTSGWSLPYGTRPPWTTRASRWRPWWTTSTTSAS